VAEHEIDRAIRRMAQTPLSRRGFLYASTLSATAAFLAACSANSGGASAAPSAGAGSTPVPSFAVPADIESELFMYNWGDYVDPDNIALFQQVYGVDKFTYDTFASNDELLTKLQGGAVGQWDISAPTAEFVPAMVEQGFIQKIDWSKIPNAQYIEAAFKGQWWDPNDEYQLPKDWGTTGISIRTKIVKEEVKTWKQFFEVAPTYSGRIVVVDSPGDVFVAPLKALGYSLNSKSESELEEARGLLMGLAPHVLALDSDQYNTKIETEEAVLGLTWTGGILELRDKPETADVVYQIPEDGTLYWLDTWVILADAPHPIAAHAFLDFIHQPQIQAVETETNQYATSNGEAKKFIDPDFLADPAVFVPDDVLAKLEGAEDLSTDPQRLDIWEEFKSKIGQGA
jgi:spermidine/putrescine transport system substrate-binding protein